MNLLQRHLVCLWFDDGNMPANKSICVCLWFDDWNQPTNQSHEEDSKTFSKVGKIVKVTKFSSNRQQMLRAKSYKYISLFYLDLILLIISEAIPGQQSCGNNKINLEMNFNIFDIHIDCCFIGVGKVVQTVQSKT